MIFLDFVLLLDRIRSDDTAATSRKVADSIPNCVIVIFH